MIAHNLTPVKINDLIVIVAEVGGVCAELYGHQIQSYSLLCAYLCFSSFQKMFLTTSDVHNNIWLRYKKAQGISNNDFV